MARTLSRRQKAAETDYAGSEEKFEEGAEEGKGTTPRRSKAASDSGSEGRRASRRGGDEPEDDTPTESTVATGWGGYKKNKEESKKGFSEDFKVEAGDPVLIKFLDEEPFASYQEHWINEMPPGERKTYICLGAKCPLCNDLGDEPNRFLVLFNIVDFTDPDNPEHKVWRASADPANAIEERALAKNSSPINRDDLYFAVSKKKNKNNFFTYSVELVKERDLEEDDWGIEPLTDDQLEAFEEKSVDKTSVKLDSVRDLQKVVSAVS